MQAGSAHQNKEQWRAAEFGGNQAEKARFLKMMGDKQGAAAAEDEMTKLNAAQQEELELLDKQHEAYTSTTSVSLDHWTAIMNRKALRAHSIHVGLNLAKHLRVCCHPQNPVSDGATRVLAFNHGYSREILLDNEEVAAIRQDIQTVRAYLYAHYG